MGRAVVFDFDGLILETESSVYLSWCRVFEEHECTPPTLEEWAAEVGTVRGLEIIEMLQSRAAITVEIDAMQERRRAHRNELVAGEVVLAGVIEWLDAAQARGLALAVASSSELDWVDSHLCRLGLRERFSHLACVNDHLRAKPAPDTYLDACATLGVEPADAIAVEDSAHGVAAAHAAGMRIVAVPNRVTSAMDFSLADVVLASLAECSLDDAITRIAS